MQCIAKHVLVEAELLAIVSASVRESW